MARPYKHEEWTHAETQRLIDLAKEGHDHRYIADQLGRSYASISTKASRINLQMKGTRSPADFDPAAQHARPCKQCSQPMISPHHGVRFCDECKDRPEWRYA